MKTVYFDAYVYNRLADEKNLKKAILKLNYDKKIEVFFSDCLFDELACAFKNNPLNGRKIFKIISKLVSGRILKGCKLLINEEIRAFLGNDRVPEIIYSPQDSAEKMDVINRMTTENPTNNQPFLELIKSKEQTHRGMKELINPYKGKVNLEKFVDFEDYYSNRNDDAAEDEHIQRFLSEIILQKSDNETLQKIKDNRHNLPHLDAHLRIFSAYRFALFKKKTQNNNSTVKKPERGDFYDMHHFTSAATIDILVCDREFLQIVEWTYPRKCCVILDNFLRLFQILNP